MTPTKPASMPITRAAPCSCGAFAANAKALLIPFMINVYVALLAALHALLSIVPLVPSYIPRAIGMNIDRNSKPTKPATTKPMLICPLIFFITKLI